MASPNEPIVPEPLIRCPKCNREMRLFGVEHETEVRDLYSFECVNCNVLAVRRVTVH